MSTNKNNKFNQTKQFIIKEADLPLSCPNSTNQPLLDMHPKIYLPIKEKKTLSCPYCGTQYIFVEEKKSHGQ